MRKPIKALIGILLVALLVVPTAAMASNGGGRSASPESASRRPVGPPPAAGRGSSAQDAEATEEGEDATPGRNGKALGLAKAKEKANEKADKKIKDKATGRPSWAGPGAETSATAGYESSRSVDGSSTPDRDRDREGPDEDGLRGIENALTRIQANILRAEDRVAAGTMRFVPPGLLRVLDKFMGWLGLDGDGPGAPDD